MDARSLGGVLWRVLFAGASGCVLNPVMIPQLASVA
jgi:hypothetical protein